MNIKKLTVKYDNSIKDELMISVFDGENQVGYIGSILKKEMTNDIRALIRNAVRTGVHIMKLHMYAATNCTEYNVEDFKPEPEMEIIRKGHMVTVRPKKSRYVFVKRTASNCFDDNGSPQVDRTVSYWNHKCKMWQVHIFPDRKKEFLYNGNKRWRKPNTNGEFELFNENMSYYMQ